MTLQGLRVLVTRAEEDAPELEELLRSRGAIPVRMPCIAFEDLEGAARLRELARTGAFDFIVVSSPHAARRVADAIGRTSAKLAAVGSATADLLPGDVIVPSEGVGARSLVAELAPHVRGKRVLLVEPERPTAALRDGLVRARAEVESLALYRTITPATADLTALQRVDALTFASGSAVRGFVSLAGARAARGKIVACIGESTADEARAAGLRVDGAGDEGLIGLCDALALAVAKRKG